MNIKQIKKQYPHAYQPFSIKARKSKPFTQSISYSSHCRQHNFQFTDLDFQIQSAARLRFLNRMHATKMIESGARIDPAYCCRRHVCGNREPKYRINLYLNDAGIVNGCAGWETFPIAIEPVSFSLFQYRKYALPCLVFFKYYAYDVSSRFSRNKK